LEVINEAWKNASEDMYKAQAEAQAANSKETKGDSKSKSNKKPKDDGDNVQDVDFEEVK
jgi:molecular chaperone DnaK